MAEVIVRVHESVASYIANAEDKNLATDIGNEVYNFQEASSNIILSRTTTLQIQFGAAIDNVS